VKQTACGHTDYVLAREYHALSDVRTLASSACLSRVVARFDGKIVGARLLAGGRGYRCLLLRQIEHAVITEQKWPGGLFRAVLRVVSRSPDVPEDDGRRLLAFADSPAQLLVD